MTAHLPYVTLECLHTKCRTIVYPSPKLRDVIHECPLAMSQLDILDRLIIRSVVEITVDQLAIVSGTIQLALPSSQQQQQQSSKLQTANVHPNTTR